MCMLHSIFTICYDVTHKVICVDREKQERQVGFSNLVSGAPRDLETSEGYITTPLPLTSWLRDRLCQDHRLVWSQMSSLPQCCAWHPASSCGWKVSIAPVQRWSLEPKFWLNCFTEQIQFCLYELTRQCILPQSGASEFSQTHFTIFFFFFNSDPFQIEMLSFQASQMAQW